MASGGCAGTSRSGKRMLRKLISRENLAALLVCLMIIALVVLTADLAPQWIYQGF